MKLKLGMLAVVAAAAVASLAAFVSPTAAAPPTVGGVTAPINAQTAQGLLSGTFTVTNFGVNSAGQIVANGVFNGTLARAPVTNQPASAPITQQQVGGTCTILDLTLGPLHLDLLGLVVDLNQVHLVITGERGPGNLLGNLLCALAGLLDGSSANTMAINQLLNRINALLG